MKILVISLALCGVACDGDARAATAPQPQAAASSAAQLFERLCAKNADRSLLLEELEKLGVAVRPVVRRVLREAIEKNEAMEDVIGLGGGAGGRFGGRVRRPVPRRGPDPLPAFLPIAEFETRRPYWLVAATPPSRLRIARTSDRADLAMEVLRRLGENAAPCVDVVLEFVQSDGHRPNAYAVHALRAMGESVLDDLEKKRDWGAVQLALAGLGRSGVEVLLRELETRRDDSQLREMICDALQSVPSWPDGVAAEALQRAAFDSTSGVRQSARRALSIHAVSLRSQLRRWRSPEYVGKKQERLATVILGSKLPIADALSVVRKVASRRSDSSREARRLVYQVISRRAAEIGNASLLGAAHACLERCVPVARESVLESVGLLHAYATLPRLHARDSATGEDHTTPAAIREGLEHRAWQVQLAASRAVVAGDEGLLDTLLRKTQHYKTDVCLDSWAAIGRLRFDAERDAEHLVRVRARIESLVLAFDLDDYSNRSGLLAIAALEATPCLGAAIGQPLLDRMAEILESSGPTGSPAWWRRPVYVAAAGLGEHAAPLAEALVSSRDFTLERARAAIHVLSEVRAIRALKRVAAAQDMHAISRLVEREGSPAMRDAIVPSLLLRTRTSYRGAAATLVWHPGFADLHMRVAERLPGDLRDESLGALLRMGTKARGVRDRVASLLEAEKSRDRRKMLERVLAAIDG